MKTTKFLKLKSRYHPITYEGITIPTGDSILCESEWLKFQEAAQKDPNYTNIIEKNGWLKCIGEVKPLPDDIDNLSEKEALTLIANTDDSQWLKRMLLKSNVQKYRKAIAYRNSLLAGSKDKDSFILKAEEMKPHHWNDLHCHYSPSDLVPR